MHDGLRLIDLLLALATILASLVFLPEGNWRTGGAVFGGMAVLLLSLRFIRSAR